MDFVAYLAKSKLSYKFLAMVRSPASTPDCPRSPAGDREHLGLLARFRGTWNFDHFLSSLPSTFPRPCEHAQLASGIFDSKVTIGLILLPGSVRQWDTRDTSGTFYPPV